MKIRSFIPMALAALALGAAAARAADVSRFFLTKGQEYWQTNATTLVSVATNKPFRFTADVEATATDSVLSAIVKLPSTQTRTLTNTDGVFGFEAAFSNKAALDAGYAAGSYGFTIAGRHDGTNQPVLVLPGDNYPVVPKMLNWDDLQAVEASQPLDFSWNTFTNGTTNDMVLLEIGGNSSAREQEGRLACNAVNTGINAVSPVRIESHS